MKYTYVSIDGTKPGEIAGATSKSLLDRMRAGDQESWRRCVRLDGPLVYSWCLRAGLASEDAGDVCQEVFRTTSSKLHLFRRDRPGDSFRKWLKTVTQNHARDHQRRNRKQPVARGGTTAMLDLAARPAEMELVAFEESDAEQALERQHILRSAAELVRAEFEDATWKAFWQSAVEGRATADVAADLGISANAVRIAKSRVRARLSTELAELLS